MDPLLRRLTGLACAAAVSGCSVGTATPPRVEVLDVRVVGVGLTEHQLATTLCETNPTAGEIAIRRVSVALDVSVAPLAAGSSDTAVRLPSLSSTAVPFTVVTTVRNIGPQLLGVLRTGGLDYRLHGTLSLDGALGLTLPFFRSGWLESLAGGLGLASAATDPAPSRCAALS